MITAAIVLVCFGLVIALISLSRRASKKPADLGVVSEAWLAEESTSGPRRY